MTQPHIDHDTLSLFVRSARSGNTDTRDYENILDHLALCEECRKQASVITALYEGWSDVQQHSDLTDEQHRLICDYIDDLLPAEKRDAVKKLIDSHPEAMKAALHYQSHCQAMQEGLSRNNTAGKTASPENHKQGSPSVAFIDRFMTLFSIRSPMIYTVTATVVLFVAVLIVARFPAMQQAQYTVATYQDNPTIRFTDANKLPGVGFFTQSGDTSNPYEDIQVELIAENTISMSWPEVDGAALYKMRLQVFNQGKKTVLKEQSTSTNHAIFQLGPVNHKSVNDNHNRRFEWVLYGNTDDDRMFYASGGFVISRTESEDRDYDTR